MRNDRGNIIVDLTFQFVQGIISFAEKLEAQRKYVIARQVLKSGASIGANVCEVQHAESKADFIHKLKIAGKEADEIGCWLDLCMHSENYPIDKKLQEQHTSITKVFSKIISSSRRATSPNYQISQSSNQK